MVLSLRLFNQNCMRISHLPVHATCTTYLIHLDLNILIIYFWRVQIMTLLIVQFFTASCHFIPLRFIYSPQHPIFKHPQSVSSLNVRVQVSHTFCIGKCIISTSSVPPSSIWPPELPLNLTYILLSHLIPFSKNLTYRFWHSKLQISCPYSVA
jgi:hypothetical protein